MQSAPACLGFWGLSIPGARLALCADDVSVRHTHGQRVRGVHRGVSGARAQNAPVNVCTGANDCQQVLELQREPGKWQDRTVEHGDLGPGTAHRGGTQCQGEGRSRGVEDKTGDKWCQRAWESLKTHGRL